MTDGKIQIQSTDNRIYTVTPEVGASGNVALTLPKEGGTLATDGEVNAALGLKADLTALALKLDATATAVNSTKWNGASMFTSTSEASGGVDGDIWFQY